MQCLEECPSGKYFNSLNNFFKKVVAKEQTIIVSQLKLKIV